MDSWKPKNLASDLLLLICELGRRMPLLLETPFQYMKRVRNLDRKQYSNSIWQLNKRGAIRYTYKNNVKLLQLTREGYIETLVSKFQIEKPKKWDGCWRVIIFDIPEDSRHLRNKLRWLLKKNNFQKLQASVFANPYPLNRSAIEYLKETELTDFVRILKVKEIDDDSDLRKKFRL